MNDYSKKRESLALEEEEGWGGGVRGKKTKLSALF